MRASLNQIVEVEQTPATLEALIFRDDRLADPRERNRSRKAAAVLRRSMSTAAVSLAFQQGKSSDPSCRGLA